MDAWFRNYMDKHGWVTCGVLAIVAIITFIFGTNIWTSNTDNVKMYEDEMIVSIDDYEILVNAVKSLQEGMGLLLDIAKEDIEKEG